MEDNNMIKEKVISKIAMSKFNEKNITIQNRKKYKYMKYAIVACTCLIFSTGIVFAKDIENYMKKLFTNSTKSINEAVENGYVQEENMEFVYSNDIGIKVSNVFLDDDTLDVAFDFEVKKENIKSVRLTSITITDDNDKIIYRSEIQYVEDEEELPIYNSFNGMDEAIKLTDTTFTSSILLGLREHDEFDKLFFEIEEVEIIYDDSREKVEGNWNMEILIDDKMKENTGVIYNLAQENEYLESCIATLLPSGLTIKLIPSFKVEEETLIEYSKKIAENDFNELYVEINGNKYLYDSWNFDANSNTLLLKYDIGAFSEEIGTIKIVSEIYDTSVILEK